MFKNHLTPPPHKKNNERNATMNVISLIHDFPSQKPF